MQRLARSEVLVVFALHAEAQKQFDDMNMIFSGMGKVNATYRLTQALHYWRLRKNALPRLVLNLGSAGSTYFNRGSVVNCTKFIQRDFDLTALGHAPYMTPSEEHPIMLSNGLRFDCFPDGTCGTGDHFVTKGAMEDWNVVDMEAYALAKVCLLENIPFASLKYITDGGNDDAAVAWEEGLSTTAAILRQAVDRLF